MQIFNLTCPQLKTLCDHYAGGPNHDKLRETKYRANILALAKHNYLEITDTLFLYAEITEQGRRRVQMAMRGDV